MKKVDRRKFHFYIRLVVAVTAAYTSTEASLVSSGSKLSIITTTSSIFRSHDGVSLSSFRKKMAMQENAEVSCQTYKMLTVSYYELPA